jgi:hypothetical protein
MRDGLGIGGIDTKVHTDEGESVCSSCCMSLCLLAFGPRLCRNARPAWLNHGTIVTKRAKQCFHLLLSRVAL